MTKPEVKRAPGVHRRADSTTLWFQRRPPNDLRHHFPSGWAKRCSLDTADIRQANVKAVALWAELDQQFERLRRTDSPQPVQLNSALVQSIAAELRRWVLEADDNARDYPELARALLRREARAASPKAVDSGRPAASLLALQITPPTPHVRDSLAGLTDDEAGALARWNARGVAQAAISAAQRDRRPVRELADAVARSMGLLVDWTTPEGRDGLLQCMKAHSEALAQVVQRDGGELIDTPPPSAGALVPRLAPTSAVTQGHTFRDAFDAWQKEKIDRPEKTEDTYRAAADRLAELLPGRTVETTTREDARNVVAALLAKVKAGQLSQNTVVNLLARFRTLMGQAVNLEWVSRNAFTGHRVERVKTSRDEWSNEDLRRLFDDPLFTGYLVPTVSRAGMDAAYWLPILGLYTGARISELAQLRVIDLERTAAAGWVLHIRDDRASGMRTKNVASKRTVPLHPELERLGLIDYRNAIERMGSKALWPAIVRSKKNGAGGKVSQWFGEYKTAKGFGTDRVFHCFRNTLETRMRALGVPQSHINAITGHSGTDGTSDDYARLKPADVRPSLHRLAFPALELPAVFSAPAWTGN